MNPLAEELNEIIRNENIHIYEMLSQVGKELYFPKGILTQSAEAKERAHKFNATIGMATEEGKTMVLPSVMSLIGGGLQPEESLTYAPSFGSPSLRSAWKEALAEKNPGLSERKISLPVVTPGHHARPERSRRYVDRPERRNHPAGQALGELQPHLLGP